MPSSHSSSRVFLLVLLVVLLLLPLQFLPALTILGYDVKRVAILGDVLPDSILPAALRFYDDGKADLPAVRKAPAALVDTCPKGMVCIEDYGGEEGRGLSPFLQALAQGEALGRPVRIAYFGDSFVESDILTDALRQGLQDRFGGEGVGWVDMAHPLAALRSTVKVKADGWTEHCMVDKGKYKEAKLNISGRYYTIEGSEARTTFSGTKTPHLGAATHHTLYLRAAAPLSVTLTPAGGQPVTLSAAGTGRLEALSHTGRTTAVEWAVPAAPGLVCWGVSEEGSGGVTVDNFSMRGSSGMILQSIPDETLAALADVRPYDLIVLHFGLNVANKKQTDYHTYAARMQRVVEKFARLFPTAGFLIVSVGDREDRDQSGELTTMRGIDALLRYQQNLAADAHVSFWNLYQAMGGEGAIRRMAEAKPAEAEKDYTHINRRGGQRIGRLLLKSILHAYDQYEKRQLLYADEEEQPLY